MIYNDEYHLLIIYHILGSYICVISPVLKILQGAILFISPIRKRRLREVKLLVPNHTASSQQSSIFTQDWPSSPAMPSRLHYPAPADAADTGHARGSAGERGCSFVCKLSVHPGLYQPGFVFSSRLLFQGLLLPEQSRDIQCYQNLCSQSCDMKCFMGIRQKSWVTEQQNCLQGATFNKLWQKPLVT